MYVRMLYKCKAHLFIILQVYRYLLKRASHHGNEHVEQDNDGTPVINAKYDIAYTLSDATIISIT